MSKISDVSQNFDEFVKQGVVVVDFWAKWCGPCRMLAPILEEVADSLTGVKFGKVDVDEAPELAKQFRIMSIPNLCVFKDGELKENVVGLRDEEELTAIFKKYL